jgi:hypothetical protein
MKRNLLLAGLLVFTSVLALAATYERGKRAQPPAIREFMRQKLAHSQAVLEGLSVEDYSQILSNAKKLIAMSQDGNWAVLGGAEYAELSQNFRRNAEALVKAANLASLDGATLAYVRVTMSCVECHKYVRSRQNASISSENTVIAALR